MLENLVLERELHFSFNGKESRGLLRIGGVTQPATDVENGFWTCFWRLDVIHPEQGKIYGLDAMDALRNCFEFIRQLIASHLAIGYEIWWFEKNDQGGFEAKEGLGYEDSDLQ